MSPDYPDSPVGIGFYYELAAQMPQYVAYKNQAKTRGLKRLLENVYPADPGSKKYIVYRPVFL